MPRAQLRSDPAWFVGAVNIGWETSLPPNSLGLLFKLFPPVDLFSCDFRNAFFPYKWQSNQSSPSSAFPRHDPLLSSGRIWKQLRAEGWGCAGGAFPALSNVSCMWFNFFLIKKKKKKKNLQCNLCSNLRTPFSDFNCVTAFWYFQYPVVG